MIHIAKATATSPAPRRSPPSRGFIRAPTAALRRCALASLHACCRQPIALQGEHMLEEELQTAIRLAHEAGDLAMQYYEGEYDVDQKSADQGPVTTADREANRLITRGLAAAFPNDGIVGEESAARAEFSAR